MGRLTAGTFSNYGYSGIGAPGLQGLSVFGNDGNAAFTRTTVAAFYGPDRHRPGDRLSAGTCAEK